MRANEFIKPKEDGKVVEVVPAIGAAIGRVGAKMGSAAAKAGVKMGAQLGKVGANKAKGIGQAAVKAVQKAQDKVSKAILKKGSQLAIPTQGGKETEFDIDDVKGDQVTLKNPEAKDIMIKLLKWADVICNNFRPGIMDKLGYSYEFCSSINPKIIYASNFIS